MAAEPGELVESFRNLPLDRGLATARAGQNVTVWIDATTCHLSVGG